VAEQDVAYPRLYYYREKLMLEVKNTAMERLRCGELALGVGLRQARTVDTAKAMKTCGFDWLFIDMEHNSMSIDTAAAMSVAAQDAGITPIVRVPGFEHFHATRVLDAGAQGVVVPHVDTPEVAAQMVSNCRYPPVGHRSVTSNLPQIDFRSEPLGEVTAVLNEATMLVLMIETPAAVENVEAIAATPGVDVLLVGTNDLCMEMGIPGQVGAPQVGEAMERIIAACHANNVFPGLGGVNAPALMEKYIEMGMRFILSGNDLGFMMAGARERTSHLRGLSL
jgi:2-keto-3-deoxy-L-rhamnonate aldolase RhmA